jgi:hypothetical protein
MNTSTGKEYVGAGQPAQVGFTTPPRDNVNRELFEPPAVIRPTKKRRGDNLSPEELAKEIARVLKFD